MGISVRIATPRSARSSRISARPTALKAATPRPETFVCFFCEAKGHKKSRCPHMRRLLNAGEIHLDWKRRICLGPSGSGYRPVWKPQGMSMMQAVFRAADADEQMQMRARNAQTTSAEAIELLNVTRGNILTFLAQSKMPNRCETPAWSLRASRGRPGKVAKL